MISANEARNLSHVPHILAKLEVQIKEAAREGFVGVWVDGISLPVKKALVSLGYEVSHGHGKDDDGIDRTGKSWIWWG